MELALQPRGVAQKRTARIIRVGKIVRTPSPVEDGRKRLAVYMTTMRQVFCPPYRSSATQLSLSRIVVSCTCKSHEVHQ
jgi:hypothetical protein